MGSHVSIKNGKRSKEWVKVRKAWLSANPPTHEGQYVCGICAKSVNIYDMELDHVNPRSGNPESLSDFSNLQPSHSYCNQMKGSRRIKPKISQEEYQLRRKLDL